MYDDGNDPLFQISPKKSTTTQLVIRNINPTLIGSLSEISTESTPAFRSSSENPKLKPMSTLKTGPAKQAVIALVICQE
jgi:hypothetical protein